MITRAQQMGTFCIIAGIAVILTRVVVWVASDRFFPLESGGRFLVATGASLFGICGASNFLNNRNDNKTVINTKNSKYLKKSK